MLKLPRTNLKIYIIHKSKRQIKDVYVKIDGESGGFYFSADLAIIIS